MSHTITGCEIHKYHWPPVSDPDVHHIIPQAHGGPNTPDNRVVICPSGHRNVHVALRAMLAGKPVPKVTRSERRLAQQGYDGITATRPHPTIPTQ